MGQKNRKVLRGATVVCGCISLALGLTVLALNPAAWVSWVSGLLTGVQAWILWECDHDRQAGMDKGGKRAGTEKGGKTAAVDTTGQGFARRSAEELSPEDRDRIRMEMRSAGLDSMDDD